MINQIVVIKNATGYTVKVDGATLTPEASQALWNHSPDGFSIGYGGSGPAQLALALLMRFTGDTIAVKLHQQFKWQFLADPALRERSQARLEIDVPGWIEAQLQQEQEEQ